ncbi:SecE-domain-containing protein [Neocallimastix lanati (nom. inval.)]|jgi:protein transport protein SEC61 subunit gamma-like protein|uniref:SecE-domain-containing protein n=1 Tax=Neocallimastix californiae TaxID=1754190 RepID=A0A1Y2AZQ7_9FUNG|nr:SecE-domain-containing protein [Neocallimastix sp. JGI-2020a]ORY27966.1 SecE-domain-containing protein [Neocallimastix californiae]|eukprot:ORY27966.1 SecE-domain-containing protein [Neocallimastix californiae]
MVEKTAETGFIAEQKQYIKDAKQLIQKCTKPDRREFIQISRAVAMGFFIMGFIGYFVKLIHIPINNIIVGA